MKRLFIVSFVFFLLIALVGCSSDKAAAPQSAESVRDVAVYRTVSAKVPDMLTAVGNVRAVDVAQVSSQMMGNVFAVNVHEGDMVKRGEVLATLDPSQAQAALERAQAAQSAAQHDLAAVQSERELAASTLKRYDTLFQRKSVSPQEYDETKARLQGAEARAEAAQSAQAQAKAAVAQAQTALAYSKIRAPFDGVVTERKVDPGALASPGMPLFTVETTGRYRLEATVDEGSLRYVHAGESVPVVLDAYPDEALSGKVTQIVPAADPGSRTFMVKIDLPQSSIVRSGLFGRAQFSRGERTALVIPKNSLVERGALKGVYVVGPDKIASLRYISLGNVTGDQVEVLSGLNANEAIVLSPADRDLGGKKIEVQ
jgi:RND family efflux transporter MFP subunit